MTSYPKKKDDISIVLCGAAGQGVQTVEQLLTHLFKRTGYHLYSTKEYMSRVRGGSNSTELRVSSDRVQAYVDRIDLLFPLERAALLHVKRRIDDSTIIIGEKESLLTEDDPDEFTVLDIPFSKLAEEIGGSIYSNIIAVGVISSFFNLDEDDVISYIQKRFSKKGDKVVETNTTAVKKGFELGRDLVDSGTISIDITGNDEVGDDIIINGGEAVALGCIAGGCNFISSYPMTPSTAVLTFLSQHGVEYGVIAEQAEDEIAAMNMAIGAWYAGARAMVTTSGGGFALMTEGVSLAGIIESPMVIHLAQRPGPATGLPTRTEQADLELALYAGHGEFPRTIYAPGTLEDAFMLSQRAFNVADTYQVPIFILTDQYFIDSYYTIPKLSTDGMKIESTVVETDDDYNRFALTENGISPRGIPGHGSGLVAVDSDEHDETGHITEDHDVRIAMNEKRLGKGKLLVDEAIPPEIIGNENAATMLVCWGSTFPVVREAVRRSGSSDIAIAYFKQVYPLHSDTASILSKAGRVAVIEGNATAQFARLLKIHTDIEVDETILKYNGLQFSVEEVVEQLKGLTA